MSDGGKPLRRIAILRRLARSIGDARTAAKAPRGAIWRGPATAPCVALTFDDGPASRWTPAILRALDAAGARATFFLIGSEILAEPELARQVARRHEVGSHLFSHRRGLTGDREAFHAELRAALDAHRRVVGTQPRWLRFPFGDAGRVIANDWRSYGLTACHWSLDSRDVHTGCGDDILRQVVPRIRSGDIVLLHDGLGADWRYGPGHRQATVDALPALLDALRRLELRTVTLSELLAGTQAHRTSPVAMRRLA